MTYEQVIRIAAHPVPERFLEHTLALLKLWMHRAGSRRELANLADHRLEDIGLTRKQALEEAAKPFWNA